MKVYNNEKIVETLEQLCKDAKKPQIQRKSKIAQLMAEMFENQKHLEKSFEVIQLRDLKIKIVNNKNLK